MKDYFSPQVGFMRRFLLIVWLLTFTTSVLAGQLASPLPVGGFSHDYNIYLGDSKIGEHHIRIQSANQMIQVSHRIQMNATFVFVTLYELQHESHELWMEDDSPQRAKLISYESSSIENGTPYKVSGKSTDGGFQIVTATGTVMSPKDIATTDSFWVDMSVLHPQLLDSVKGKIVPAAVKALGSVVESGKKTERYELEAGDRSAEGWFANEILVKAIINRGGHQIYYKPVQTQ